MINTNIPSDDMTDPRQENKLNSLESYNLGQTSKPDESTLDEYFSLNAEGCLRSIFGDDLSKQTNLLQYVHELHADNWNERKGEDKLKIYERLRFEFMTMYMELWNCFDDQKENPAYWNLLRCSMLNPSSFNEKQIQCYKKQFIDIHDEYENIFFVDEWLRLIGEGSIAPSEMVFEEQHAKNSSAMKMEKLRQYRIRIYDMIKLLEFEREGMERGYLQLQNYIKQVEPKRMIFQYENRKYETVRIVIPTLFHQLKLELQEFENDNKRLEINWNRYQTMMKNYNQLLLRLDQNDLKSSRYQRMLLRQEMMSVFQMTKMTQGRSGLKFPYLLPKYFVMEQDSIFTKNHCKKFLEKLKALDYTVFETHYKNRIITNEPYFLLLPSYGNFGVCWETGKHLFGQARLALPMFPLNADLFICFLYAIGLYRWQKSKEQGLQYWMEEGLTGEYYQYYLKKKLKGNVEVLFVQDYIKWIVFESKGIQRLEKEVRKIFWRKIPFLESVKQSLKNKGFYYQELLQKDLVIKQN